MVLFPLSLKRDGECFVARVCHPTKTNRGLRPTNEELEYQMAARMEIMEGDNLMVNFTHPPKYTGRFFLSAQFTSASNCSNNSTKVCHSKKAALRLVFSLIERRGGKSGCFAWGGTLLERR